MAEPSKKLNKEQLKAVIHGKGPLLIIAGAGTGKTTVITERILYLINKGLAKPSEILALTFTDKAAREMEERVDLALPYGYTDMWILTFHSFCDKVLRQEALQIGLDPGYKLMSNAESTQFLIRNLFKLDLQYFRPLGNPTKFVEGILQHFSRLKDEDIDYGEYLEYVSKLARNPKESNEEKNKIMELARSFQKYEELKTKEGVMDFADLISNTLKLFRNRKNILRQYQGKFKYILVDEFQDTNYAQNQLAVLIAGNRQNITVCGDDDQSIYRWRGAAISNVIQFKQYYPKAKIVVLIKNYRSTQLILDHAYKLIQNNNPDRLEVRQKIDKHLKATRKIEARPIEFIRTDRVENEAEEVVKKIQKLTNGSEGNYEYKDIAILVRANNHADPFIQALTRRGVPYQFLGPGQLFRQPEVKDLIAYLKVLYNFEDNISLYRVISMDYFAVPARDLAAINNYSRRMNVSLFEACESSDKIFISPKTKDKISQFVKMVYRHLKLIPKESAGQILYYFLDESGILKGLSKPVTAADERKAQNISKFFDRLKTYEVDHEDSSVHAMVDWINLSMQLGESPLASDFDWYEENRVNILTIHSSKGLEFPVVFLVNLVAARFPTSERKEKIPIPESLIKEILPTGDYHLEEERRLFYVGMTRARDRLFLTAANYYGEGKREKRISPFVSEALGGSVIKSSQTEKKKSQQLTIFDWQRPKTQPESAVINYRQPINYLSYSQIETFDTCPLQYRYRYIQRIPVPPSAASSFGDSIHKTLRDFYQSAIQGNRPKESDLLNIFSQNWNPLGFSSKAHEKRAKAEGERILKNFYQNGFNPEITPKALEQVFVIKISPMLKIGGKIDRVDQQKNGLEIIDYKTGKVWDQKVVDKSLQMTVYALAAADKGIWAKKPEELFLTFLFLETGEKKSTKRTTTQLEQAKKELVEKAKKIQESEFQPTPGIWCDFCDFRMLCEAWS